jgi:uncharacterized membrane protein YoaK (UPF0700 family)
VAKASDAVVARIVTSRSCPSQQHAPPSNRTGTKTSLANGIAADAVPGGQVTEIALLTVGVGDASWKAHVSTATGRHEVFVDAAARTGPTVIRRKLVTGLTTTDGKQRVRDRLMVLLAVNSGAADAIGFLCLGGAFTSVMTGNMVILGLSASQLNSSLAVHAGAAIIGYIAGSAVGTRIAGSARPDDPVWPRPVTLALQVQFLVMAGYVAGWELTGAHPTGAVQVGLLLINAIASGMQSGTVARFGVSGLSTTYLTGTLTTLVTHVVSGRRLRKVQLRVQILLGLICGAALGGALALLLPRFAPAIQLGSVAIVILRAISIAPPNPAGGAGDGRYGRIPQARIGTGRPFPGSGLNRAR